MTKWLKQTRPMFFTVFSVWTTQSISVIFRTKGTIEFMHVCKLLCFFQQTSSFIWGRLQLTQPQSEVDIRQEIEVGSQINSTRCFRSGLVMTVKELQVNDSNFPVLHKDQIAQGCATQVVKKIKRGYTMTLCKVQERKVTTFLPLNPPRGGSSWPYMV